MRVHVPLDDLIGGKTSVRVLRTLSLFPGKEFTGRELAQMSGGAPSKVIGELERFRGLGIVTRKSHGRTHAWKLNPDHALIRLLKPAFEEEHTLPAKLLADLRHGVADARISRAILFGSFARGDERGESDVDLLVLARRASDLDAVRSVLDELSVKLSQRYGIRLAPVLHAEHELARLRKLPLLARIAEEGRVIRGEPL